MYLEHKTTLVLKLREQYGRKHRSILIKTVIFLDIKEQA